MESILSISQDLKFGKIFVQNSDLLNLFKSSMKIYGWNFNLVTARYVKLLFLVWVILIDPDAFVRSFSYRGKVIIKGASNILRSGYSIIIKMPFLIPLLGRNAVDALDATDFKEMKDLIPFHVFLCF